MAYIIDSYNRYDKWDQEHSEYVFCVNDNWYAIKRVILFWGKPQLPTSVLEDRNPESYFIFNSIQEAMEFVQKIKSLNQQ